MASLFISYRRSDAEGWAGRLSDSPSAHLGRVNIFRDIEDIPAGVDFEAYITEAVGSCSAPTALIGPHWLAVTDKAGRRRLDDPADFTRLEIATALQRNVRVIPTLVDNAQMPTTDELPEELKPPSRRQAYELTDARWADDCRRLANVLKPIVKPVRRFDRGAIVGLGLIVAFTLGGLIITQWNTHIKQPSPTVELPTTSITPSGYRIFLHTNRSPAEVEKVRTALEAVGYTIAGQVNPIDPIKDKNAGIGVDYSIKDGNKVKEYEIQATKIDDIVNQALGIALQPRKQSTADPGYFGIWF